MRTRSPLFIVILSLLSIIPVIAQSVSCPALVDQALIAVGDNCADMGRNSACYGYNRVDATFTTEVQEGFFAHPADRAELTALETIRTAPLDTELDRWGVAVMNVQANLPNTVPGQGVIMMLVGDAEVRNEVPSTDATVMIDPISTATIQETSLHTSPSDAANIIETLPVNSLVLIDGVSPNLDWFRVVTDGTISWIAKDTVAKLGAMESLPVVGASYPTPMQAFYFTTGIGDPECNEAESMVAVQSPENIKIDLTVNGVDIKVGSLITFQNLDPTTINLTVHRGEVSTIFGNIIEAGQSALGVLNSDPLAGEGIIAWSNSVPADPEDLFLGETAQKGINFVAQSNGWDERQIEETSQEEPTTESGEIIHIVQAGESLYSIGRLYDASLPAIVARNGLNSPFTLFVGQQLVIPNPGSGFVGLPASTAPQPPVEQPVEQPGQTLGTCDALKLTSPLTSAPSETAPYYWDGVIDATQYQVKIYDQATGKLMATLNTIGNETTINVSPGKIGVGGAMQWEVLALKDGQVICGTGLSAPLTHSAPVQEPVDEGDETPNFHINWYCDSGDLVVEWRNAYPDDRVRIRVTDLYGATYNNVGSGENGQTRFGPIGIDYTNAKGTTTSGLEDTKSGSKFC